MCLCLCVWNVLTLRNNLVVYILTYIPRNQHVALASAKVPKFNIMAVRIGLSKEAATNIGYWELRQRPPAASGEAM